MLVRTDPFRELERLSQQVFGGPGTAARPSVMPMDAWREGDVFVLEFDLPGIDPETIDLDVESNVLTIRVERALIDGERDVLAAERPRGVFSRQVMLGENLDTARIEASYAGGVLGLRIPIAESAKPRKIQISTEREDQKVLAG
jgi:HSP20 family protein